MNLSERKLILALLYADGKNGPKEEIEGITRFEKLIFLLTNSYYIELLENLNYKADNFGPYSDRLVDNIENLKDLKLIEIKTGKNKELADEFKNYNSRYQNMPDIFKLSIYGGVLAKKIFSELSEEDKKRIVDVKKKFNSIPLDSLLGYVYNNVDENRWLKNSEIKDKYLH